MAGRHTPTLIGDTRAAEIAQYWAGTNEANLISQFAATGEIVAGHLGTAWMVEALVDNFATATEQEEQDVRALLAYVEHHGARGPVDGWSES